MRFLQPPSDFVTTAYHHVFAVSCYVAAGFAFGVTIVVARVQCRLENLQASVCCHSTHCSDPLSGLLVSVLLVPLHPTQSPFHIHRMLFPPAADCPEFDTSVSLVDFYTVSIRWYVLVIECQASSRFCVPPPGDGITSQANQSLRFRRKRPCTRCFSCSASSTVAFTSIHPPERPSAIPSSHMPQVSRRQGTYNVFGAPQAADLGR